MKESSKDCSHDHKSAWLGALQLLAVPLFTQHPPKWPEWEKRCHFGGQLTAVPSCEGYAAYISAIGNKSCQRWWTLRVIYSRLPWGSNEIHGVLFSLIFPHLQPQRKENSVTLALRLQLKPYQGQKRRCTSFFFYLLQVQTAFFWCKWRGVGLCGSDALLGIYPIWLWVVQGDRTRKNKQAQTFK